MQCLPLAILTTVAPLSAAAFGDMDCIAVETCTSETCEITSAPFAVTFDWTAGTVAVELDSEATIFQESALPEPSPTTLVYGDFFDNAPGLLLNAEDADSIIAYLTLSAEPEPGLIQYTGECSPRRAI